MVCSTEVYQWFKELSPFNRIDFLCSIMQLCLPNELRFIGTLLDDMNNKDYANLREAEDRSNSPNEFRQYPTMPFNEEGVRRLCLSLSLLKSTNQKVGQIIYEILKIHFYCANECVKLKDKFSNEVLLLYALASYHPAFTFENRFKIGEQFKILQSIYENSTEEFYNNNNSCCYKDINKNSFLNINIKSVTLEHLDANIILEISSDNPQNSNIEKVTTFSKIIELFKESKYFTSDLLHLEITDITKNGNFNTNNIQCICQKIIKFLNSNSDEDNQFIQKFFLQLPVNHKKTKSNSSQVETTNSNSREDFISTDEISLKSNFKFLNQNYSTHTSCYKDLKNETPIKDNLNKTFKFNNSEKSEIILKENMYSDINKDLSNQNVTETFYLHDSLKIQETFESTPSEMSDSIINSDGSHYQELTPIQVNYILPPYYLFTAMKSSPSTSSSSSSQFVYYSNNNNNNNNNSSNNNNNNSFEQIHPGNNNNNKSTKTTRNLIPEQYLLAHYPNIRGSFNSCFHSFGPLIYSMNQSTMINDMHYEPFYTPHRMYSVTAATNIIPSPQQPAVAGISKLSSCSSSTPPRLQSNYHKSSSQYSTNFSGS